MAVVASSTMPSIVVTGSIGIDTIETPGGRADHVLGGSAPHFAVAASLYTDVGLVGVVGSDFPEEHREFLQARKIDLEGLEVSRAKTFRWTGRYHENLNHRTTVEVRLDIFDGYRPKVPEVYRSPRILFLANVGPDVQLDVLDGVGTADLVAADTMELWIETRRDEVDELLARVDLLFLNEDEARHLTGCDNLYQAGRRALELGPRLVVLKKGSHGAILFDGDSVFCVPAYPWTQVVDPTGAGDAFAGGFLGHLAREGWTRPESLRHALVHGSIMGSVNVAGFSCHAFRELDPGEIDRRFERFREITRF